MAKHWEKENVGKAAEITSPEAPQAVKLVRRLRGHMKPICRIAWSPDGRMLASSSCDKTVRLWDSESDQCLRTFEGHTGAVRSVAFDPAGTMLASAGEDTVVMLWEPDTGRLLRTLAHGGHVNCVAFDPAGQILAGGNRRGTIMLWDVSSGRLVRMLEVRDGPINCVAFHPAGRVLASGSERGAVKLWEVGSEWLLRSLGGGGRTAKQTYCVAFDHTGQILASGSSDGTVALWEVESGRLLRTLEGHSGNVEWIEYSPDGRLIGTKSNDDTFRLWRADTMDAVAIISAPKDKHNSVPGFAFHPRLETIATVGSESDAKLDELDRLIHIWEFDLTALLGGAPKIETSRYVNAKVVLLGDTGVGKSGLSLVLNGKRFEATDSTPGRRIWTLQSEDVKLDEHRRQTRETLLWDLAGQPGYRVIHQLHLNEVAVALLVFDSRSETDPLAGVRHWERALRLAQQRQSGTSVPMKKFLVSARADRGTVSVSKERLEALVRECDFERYFETGAKEGWNVAELRQAIQQAIPWAALPEVSSSILFADIKAFLLEIKKSGRLVALGSDLYDEFARAHADTVAQEPRLRDQFETCVGRIENRDLIRRLSFGGYILLQPELLDAYASAIVNTAKEEPDGLGSLAEDAALAGQFYVPAEQKVKQPLQEQLLLHATVEELVRHDLALRENASDGRYLVFPSQFNRDYEDAPEPKGKTLTVTFDGPVQSLYSTLVVRLGHSGLFTAGRAEMWRNAAIFTAWAGGKCGLYLHEFAEARGRMVIFYNEYEGHSPSDETRFHFEEFVLAHVRRRALDGLVDYSRFFVCTGCGIPVHDSYVKQLRGKGVRLFNCPCGRKVSLEEPAERLKFASKVNEMDESADRQRNFETFVASARGETSTPDFSKWAGDNRLTLAIVFTDVVGSTALGEELKDERMEDVRREHFAKSRMLIDRSKGREIKTIGDSFLTAFYSVEKALEYALALQSDPGHPALQVRAGIHIGPLHVEEGDVFGGTVNFAARVIGAINDAEIWLSDRAKEDLDRGGARIHEKLVWKRHDGVEMKGFPGAFTLWSLNK